MHLKTATNETVLGLCTNMKISAASLGVFQFIEQSTIRGANGV